MIITRITRAPYTFTLPAAVGDPAAVSVAVLPKRHGPNGSTVWQAADAYDPETRLVTITYLAGPDADSTGALAVPAEGGDLWAADVDAPIINAARVERIVVQGGSVGTVTPDAATELLAALALKADADDERFTDARVPTGGAGGALSGTYPNPGLNTAAVDTSVAANIDDTASDTSVALRTASEAVFSYKPFVEALNGPPPPNNGTPMTANRSVFNSRAWQLRRTRAAIATATAGLGDGVILCIGDSNTFGLGAYFDAAADVAGRSWTDRLGTLLATQGVPVSPGGPFFPAPTAGRDSRWVTSGSVGISNGLLFSIDPGGSGTYTVPGTTARRISVTYLDRFGGTFTIAIDGGAPTTVTRASGFTGGYNRWESPLLAAGAHTVTITGSVHVAYIEGRLDNQGIRIAKAGVAGSTATQWASTADLNYLDNALTLFPKLTVMMLGTNDWQRPAADVAAELDSIITRVRAKGSEVLLVGPPTRAESDFATLYAQLYPLAVTRDVPLLDLRERLGLYADAKTYGVFSAASGDTVHLSTIGLADVGRAVHGAIAS